MGSQIENEKRMRCRSAATAQVKAELQKSIQRAKDRMWNDSLTNLWGAEEWRAAKFANPQVGATVEALTDRDGKETNTGNPNKDILKREPISVTKHDHYSPPARAVEPH